jgi:hypothetical protein
MHRSLLFLVLVINVGPAILDQELGHVEFSSSSRIIQGCLPVVINRVRLRIELSYQPLDYLGVTLPRCVKHGRLSIRILVIDIAPVSYQEISQVYLPVATRVIQRGLIELILSTCINAVSD